MRVCMGSASSKRPTWAERPLKLTKRTLPRPERGGGWGSFVSTLGRVRGAALVRRSCFVGTAMKDALLAYVKRVKSLHEKVRNEEATKSSLIGPLFTLLGYDLADPEE